MYKSSTTYTIHNSYVPTPEAYITKGKNRLKQHGQSVYLNNNEEFEIELFNPKTTTVLAKIKLNGNYISTRGLVLKPGQRVHLDRFIDDAKKFMYSTYEVEGDNAAVKQAIALNGNVDVEFYDETVPLSYNFNWMNNPGFTYTNTINVNDFQPTFDVNNVYYSNTSGTPSFSTGGMTANGHPLMSFGAAAVTDNLMSFSTSSMSDKSSVLRSKSMETGRVEQGGTSNTKLKDVNMDFNAFASNTVSWKIMPQSQQPVQTSDIKNYCTGCGFRLKKDNWTFCPKCGNKI